MPFAFFCCSESFDNSSRSFSFESSFNSFFSLVSILNGWNGCLDWVGWIDFEGFWGLGEKSMI
jgi:hypothetical protein